MRRKQPRTQGVGDFQSILCHLPIAEAHHLEAERAQAQAPSPVLLECIVATMESKAVRFYDEPLLAAPEKVDLEATEIDIHFRSGKAVSCAELKKQVLEAATSRGLSPARGAEIEAEDRCLPGRPADFRPRRAAPA